MTNELGIVIENNRPVVSSRKVAEVFEKEHRRVMQSIRELECNDEFNQHNFVLVEYKDAKGEMRPEYLMTRLGFSVLTMGFTGAKAMQWKIKYAEAFEKMEAERHTVKLPATYLEALEDLVKTERERLVLEAQIAEDKPYTALGRALTPDQKETSVGQMATILSQTTGHRISRNTLFKALENKGYLCITGTEWHRPQQIWQDRGILRYRIFKKKTKKGEIHIFTPYFTPKGRLYIEKNHSTLMEGLI